MSKDGLQTNPKKIKAINDWPVPKTVTEVCSLFGFANYHR